MSAKKTYNKFVCDLRPYEAKSQIEQNRIVLVQ
jgi:hypothetical protein